MQTITITTYKFSELSEEAQEKALETFRNFNVEIGNWWEFVYDDWKEKLEALGYYNIDISFSGFWSQGDGASFTASVDIDKWIKANKRVGKYPRISVDSSECSIKIIKSGRYEHEMTMSVDVEYGGNDQKINDTIDELGEEILEDARDQARQIYKDLEKEYEHLTSDEVVKDAIETNDYNFLESGKSSYNI